MAEPVGPSEPSEHVAPKDEKTTPDEAAAHAFLTEIRTRIATQALPFRKGVEDAALTGLYDLFKLARTAIKDHPGCGGFAKITVAMLNEDLRPVTAEWHRRSTAGDLGTRDGAIAFRAELSALQKKLRIYANDLHQMAYGTPIEDAWGSDQDEGTGIDLTKPLVLGVREDDLMPRHVAQMLNAAEAAQIRAIRAVQKRPVPPENEDITEATGLAFSGGGIRSASFGLGVAQALAEKGLLKGFDLMSTVSGGGFVGGFITQRMGARGEAALNTPNGPDTEEVAYLRQRASYLIQGTTRRAKTLASQIVAGMLLNWAAPGLVIALLALIMTVLPDSVKTSITYFPWVGALLAAVSLLAYGWTLGSNATFAESALKYGLGTTVLFILADIVYRMYGAIPNALQDAYGWTLTGVIGAAVPAFTIASSAIRRPIVQRIAVAAAIGFAAIIVPLVILTWGMLLYYLGELPMNLAGHWASPLTYLDGLWVLVGITLALTILSCMIDINLTGPHRIYRDSLIRTFVQTSEAEVVRAPLKDMNPEHRAPHHLINAAVNLPHSTDVRLRERKGDFYVFSKTYCGSPTTKYHRTETLMTAKTDLDLGTAIATSGAAVAPYMVLLSVASARSLLAFLNIRLGFWLGVDPRGKVRNRPGFWCLLREMFGFGMKENANWLFLTDGGHIENSGVYELLRRRCRYIVAVDAGSDAINTFGTLATLSRHARIDLGVELDWQLDDLRVDVETGLSPAHAVLTRVVYPAIASEPKQEGLLLLIKLSVTGDEGEIIRAYKEANPDFPIQSTADQVFDQAQFENYRRLGVHATESLFAKTLIGDLPIDPKMPANVGAWLNALARTLRP